MSIPPDKKTGAKSRPAAPLDAGWQFGRTSCAPSRLSAAVAQFYHSVQSIAAVRVWRPATALKGQRNTAQGKRAGRRASPWVQRQTRFFSPERVAEMSGRRCRAKIPIPEDVFRFSVAPSGQNSLWGHQTQGGAPPRVGACPGLYSFAPLGLETPNLPLDRMTHSAGWRWFQAARRLAKRLA
jgi:hypothetical protein